MSKGEGKLVHEQDADPASGRGKVPLGQRIRSLIDDQVAQSREEAQHQAAIELQQFMEPSRQQLVLNVPGSSSPEEAQAILDRQTAMELERPVTVSPASVIDLRNPSSMGAYPPEEKLSNRVLRLANRHWAKDKPRASDDIRAEKAALADREFALKPTGTQRCFAPLGSLRCRGVFAFRAEHQAGRAPIACPTCGASHRWDPDAQTWAVDLETSVAPGREPDALASSS